ncbi:MAG TPA: ATP-binding cassette domain-containing protein, partial [Symbiobacteriaceae bacterium]|nr:ATP-binding cassette domain-containing protein [Symbiobacteriaceae bacterium]
MPIIQATGVTKIYGSGPAEVHALWGIDFAAERGEFVAIMGSSGSGKSTLLSILGGLESATYGQVRLDGQALDGLPESELAVIRREKIGFVFQSFNLVPVLTAAENVAVPL